MPHISVVPGHPLRGQIAALVLMTLTITVRNLGQDLPAPADLNVDFTRDVLPILEESCLRCHGAEDPKAGYRMTTRAYLMTEGDYGANIIEGNSAESTLIQYASHLEEDMEMPPLGKGDKLTDSQIGILRAWIDQGVPFEDIPEESFNFKASPHLRFIGVSGNKAAFQEHHWMQEGFTGGFESFEWSQTMEGGRSFTGKGTLITPHNRHAIEAEIAKRDLGFFRFGFDQSRTYDHALGGISPLTGLGPWTLDRPLHQNLSSAWFEFGLDRPKLPRITLGYTYREQDGSQSMLQWGPAFDSAFNSHNIYPAWKRVDQQTHIIHLDMTHAWKGWQIEDRFRGEFYAQDNVLQTGDFIAGGDTQPSSVSTHRDDYTHFQGSNALTVQRRIKPWWLASAGYYVSRLHGDATLSFGNQDPTRPGTTSSPFSSRGIEIRNDSHVMNVNSLLGPWENWTAYGGIQPEWSRRKGAGNTTFFGIPSRFGSNMDRFQVEENVGLRYRGFADAVFYADARIKQESIGQSEEGLLDDGFAAREDFMRKTNARGNHVSIETGTTLSPWKKWTFNPTYGYKRRHHTFRHPIDSDLGTEPANGYPAFILERLTEGHNWGVKTRWKPLNWIHFRLSYENGQTEYRTGLGSIALNGKAYPGGKAHSGNYDTHAYRLTMTLTPTHRWFWTISSAYTDERIISAINDNLVIAPYDGDLYSLYTSWTFLWNKTTQLQAGYTFSHADYGQTLPLGLPMGSRFDQHSWQCKIQKTLSKNGTLGLQYGYYLYSDDLAGGFLDYEAHGIFATWSRVFP
ncbi:MAG: hypothetical protein P8L18_13370 [Verrucomicrobiota bacterium]|nr:hypothetical protein [Verrucomicrobiota bacterium]